MIAPPRSASGRSSSHTVELQALSRTAGLRPSRRHTSQTLVGYAIPSTAAPGSAGANGRSPANAAVHPPSPPQSGQVAIPPPIIEEPPATTQQTPGQSPPTATNGAPSPSPSVAMAEPQPVAEGTWAKVSAIASLYQAVLATIQTAGGIAFGVAAIVVGVKALQLAQLQYCEDHKTDNSTFFCKLLIRAGVESTAIFKRDGGAVSDGPSNLQKFVSWFAIGMERLLPSHEEPSTLLGRLARSVGWGLFLRQWERMLLHLLGLILLFAIVVNAVIICAKPLVPLLAWRVWVMGQLLDEEAKHAPRLASPDAWSRVVAASKPLILCLAMSDALSTVGGFLLLWTGPMFLLIVAAVTGSVMILVLVASWSLGTARKGARPQQLSGWEVGAQVVLGLSLLGLAHGTNSETGPVMFFSICQMALSLGGFAAAGYHRFEWRKLASLGIDGNELMGVIHVMLTVGDIFFPNKITLWALGVKGVSQS